MASASLGSTAVPRAGEALGAAVRGEGSAAHPWAAAPALTAPPDAARNLADLVHYLCILHGRYPGVVDHATLRTTDPEARGWLANAAYAFAGERAFLARLAAAAGPVPSTPGAADTDAVVQAQRHAIEMLAQSERIGCALGAAMALVLDWAVVRRALDAAARRFGLETPAYAAPDPVLTEAVADRFAGASPTTGRALLFGARQILAQHHGLLDLLEARAQARQAAAA
ncbi:MAG: hypothetical protein JO013_14095 [Alphaproteobacteria bacterium]|nr:hypothetical protein [Alphaproteobacteria bacterium]